MVPPLQLVATAPDDLPILSSHWQDALIYPRHMHHDPRRQIFVILGVRICREQPRSWRGLMRTRSFFYLRAVERVQQRYINLAHAAPLALLAILYEARTPPACRLRFIFAGQAELLFALEALDIRMKDDGRAWRSWRRVRHVL